MITEEILEILKKGPSSEFVIHNPNYDPNNRWGYSDSKYLIIRDLRKLKKKDLWSYRKVSVDGKSWEVIFSTQIKSSKILPITVASDQIEEFNRKWEQQQELSLNNVLDLFMRLGVKVDQTESGILIPLSSMQNLDYELSNLVDPPTVYDYG